MPPRQPPAHPARFTLIAAGILGPLAAPAHGLLIRDDLTLSDYTDQAALEPFSATGGFEINGSFESSGVLVAPDLVLGAAHPGAAITAENNPDAVTFVLNGVTHNIASVDRFDTTAGANDADDGRDVALYTLTAPVTDVTPAVVYSGTPESTLGLEAVYTGAGFQGTGLTGPNTTDGVVLAGTNVVDDLGIVVPDEDGVLTDFADTILFADFDNPNDGSTNFLGDASATTLETQATVGDSGGGLFVFNDDTQQFELAALHSFILTDGSDDFGFGSSTASTTFLPEDLAVIQAAIPEPATAALLGLALPLIAGRRRRSSIH